MGRSGKIKGKKKSKKMGRPKKESYKYSNYTNRDNYESTSMDDNAYTPSRYTSKYDKRQQSRLGGKFTPVKKVKGIKNPKGLEKVLKQGEPSRTAEERELDDLNQAIWANPYGPDRQFYGGEPRDQGWNLRAGQHDGDLGRRIAREYRDRYDD